MPKSAETIIQEANALAREFYRIRGYAEKEGYQFHKATHPQERECWEMAVVAYAHLKATDLNDSLIEANEI